MPPLEGSEPPGAGRPIRPDPAGHARWGQRLLLVLLATLALWLASVHATSPPALPGWRALGWAMLACALYVALCLLGAAARGRRETVGQAAGGVDADTLLVAHASQTGFAEQLAADTARSLADAGASARVLRLADLDIAALRSTRRILFIASTSGEGDPPDEAHRFARDLLPATPGLEGLEYGLLALGDRGYARFCGFGRQLDDWLARCGARALFDRIEVDRADPMALDDWRRQLGRVVDAGIMPALVERVFDDWRLCARRQTNPGSPGAPVFDIALRSEAGQRHWSAGDIAEVAAEHPRQRVADWLRRTGIDGTTAVRHGDALLPLARILACHQLPEVTAVEDIDALVAGLRPLPHREYSIASIPAEGELRLLVRQVRTADGGLGLGLGSGWLTRHAPAQSTLRVRIRRHRRFHLEDTGAPLVLIGNGTGLAGLRAHLAQRAANGRRRNWLVFGERDAGCDLHYAADIERWQAEGFIDCLDLVYSRAPGPRRYVQHRLAERSAQLRDWVEHGASVLVCGSREGMAPAVHAVLADALGDAGLEHLASEGRYRRDVY